MTNTLRHSGARRLRISVMRHTEELEIVVRDDGRGAGDTELAESTGHGIPGMAERVEALGGSLTVGPSPDGGF